MSDIELFPYRLTKFFKETPGAVLRAQDYFRESKSKQVKQVPAFEMASGSQQRDFVSLWALFKHRDIFQKTAEHLAEMARDIRASSRFTTIVTCTATSKYIMDQLHAELEASEKQKIDIRYFGPYPYHIVESADLRDLHNHRVLILTDVIATGKLVSHLASVVEALGGAVAAILAVAVTNPEFCAQKKELRSQARVAFRMFHSQSLNTPLPVYNIVDLPSEIISEAVKPPYLVKVDPVSIMPSMAEPCSALSHVEPLIALHEAVGMAERTNAIAIGFYGSEFRRFSFALRLGRVLEDRGAGDVIWKKIQKIIKVRKRPLFVSTFDLENLRFSDFIAERLARGRASCDLIYIPQTQDSVSISGFFISAEDRRRISGRDIFVVLGTANTSERLRNLISIVACEGPNSITALVLLDRMDLSSAHFVPLVRTLSSHRKLTWQGSLFNPGGIAFSCHSVFRFRDFGTNDLGRMQAMVNRLLGAYHKWCRTSSFQLLTEHDLKYFATRRMSGYDFERISLAKAREETSLCVEGSKLKASSGDAQIFIMILKCVYEKDYDSLIDYLYFAHDKTLIYAIVALLLTDVSFLRASGAFGRLIGVLRRRIKESRAERQGLEIAFQEKWRGLDKKDAAEEAAHLKAGFDLAVRTESYLIFALSLFGFLDTTNEYHSTILEVLGGQGWTPPGIAPEGLPLNFVATMRETRTLWAACMLAFFTDRPFRDATAQSAISRAMLDQAKINDTVLSRIQKSCEPDELPDVLAAIANIDGLRTELREYNLKLPEEAIRLMHKQLILQPSRHNPI